METFTDMLLVTANVGSLFDNVSGPVGNKVAHLPTLERRRGIMCTAVCFTEDKNEKKSSVEGAGGKFFFFSLNARLLA